MISEYDSYVSILKEELVPALGCTEPIALAYGAAVVREFLHGEEPLKVRALCSGNIIKNAMCVKVPNTGGLIGIEAAVLAGLTGGDPALKMEVISGLGDEDCMKIQEGLKKHLCSVELLASDIPLNFIIEAASANHTASVEIAWKHTHISAITADGIPQDLNEGRYVQEPVTDRSCLQFRKILEFAETVRMEDVEKLIRVQIEDNMAIAEEGMAGGYGVGIGQTIVNGPLNCTVGKMLAYTAAASEARMEGCSLPVITNSGSGNQGIASSVPVIIYCRENGIAEEKMLRALVLSNLLTIYQKTGIGALSAFCGVVCASVSAAAAVTWLRGGGPKEIGETITNSYGSVAGTVCDGAKATCGFKIYGALSSALLAGEMAVSGKAYPDHTGIIKADPDEAVQVIGELGRLGMVETDRKILEIMLREC